MFATAYAEGVPWNESYWSNERFNELLVAARSELDEDIRREMYFEMQDIRRQPGRHHHPDVRQLRGRLFRRAFP